MLTREAHPLVKHFFSLIADEKLTPDERLKQMALTLEIIQESIQKDLEISFKLKKLSLTTPFNIQEEELKMLYSFDAVEKGVSLLNFAIEKQMPEIVRFLLKNGATAGFISPKDGAPPLNKAVVSNNAELVEMLLKARADVNLINQQTGDTPLIIASRNRSIEIVRMLLKAGAETFIANTSKEEKGFTPISYAAMNGDFEIFNLLIDAKADFKCADKNGDTPLHKAAFNGHMIVAQTLLDAKVDVDIKNSNSSTPLMFAVRKGHLEMVKLLLKAGADPKCSDKHTSLLNCAAREGFTEITRVLLDSKADPNFFGQFNWEMHRTTPLIEAASKESNSEIINLLLQAKANPDYIQRNEKNALYEACDKNFVENVKALLQGGAYPDIVFEYSGWTPLLLAALRGYTQIVIALLEAKADPNLGAKTNKSPLYLASEYNHFETVIALLQRGANVDALALGSITSLFFAAQEGFTRVAVALLEAKADPDFIYTENGTTPLIWASRGGNVDLVTALLNNKADPNLENKKNPSVPLSRAAGYDHPQIVSILLEKKARIDKTLNNGNTVLENLILEKKPSGVALLLSHDAIVIKPKQLYDFLMDSDLRDPGVLNALQLFCEQQRNLREHNIKDKTLLLSDDDFKLAEIYLEKLTELSNLYKQKMHDEVIKGAEESKNIISSSVLKIVTDYCSPLESLSLFNSKEIDKLITEAKSQEQKELPAKSKQ